MPLSGPLSHPAGPSRLQEGQRRRCRSGFCCRTPHESSADAIAHLRALTGSAHADLSDRSELTRDRDGHTRTEVPQSPDRVFRGSQRSSVATRQRSPALRSGEYYQAWLKNSAGALVPIGTFSSSDGRVTLWSVVSPKDFPTITVTMEATDNDQISSGRRGRAHS